MRYSTIVLAYTEKKRTDDIGERYCEDRMDMTLYTHQWSFTQKCFDAVI